MNSLPLSELSVVIQTAVVLIAIVAAWRHKLKGLWILAAAAVMTGLHDILHVVLRVLMHNGNENLMPYWVGLQYVPFVAMTIALSGWCVLVFSRRENRPNSD